MKKIVFTVWACFVVFGSVVARQPDSQKVQRKSTLNALQEGCTPATAQTDLSINNVRTRILAGGDMWWDLSNAKYEVPKGSGKHSMFAGALWLGGYDDAKQLKIAAATYRQNGVDFWTGPLSDDNTASVTSDVCNDYDTQWLIYRNDVITHKAWLDCKADPTCDVTDRFPGYEGSIPTVIKEWPGNGIDQELPNKLAPYIDYDSAGTPGVYEWEYDYPAYDIDENNRFDCRLKEVDLLYGDETIWWVYNDKGNTHAETNGGALGFEIRAQAFAFTSNDEVNNMTFNNYRIINKSTFRLSETYFGTWFDPDIGNPDDDIIGCDIPRGLGYCYNGKAEDDGPRGYGTNPPAIGFDFFQGPFADYDDDIDNDRDGCVDGVLRILEDGRDTCIEENPITGINERIIMSGFMYYNRPNSGDNPPDVNTTDPDVAQHFYNYLNVKWRNGTPLVIDNPSGPESTDNGSGYVTDTSGYTVTKFAYPGTTYDVTGTTPPFDEIPNGGWYESPDNNADKRGLHTAGPFSLAPGALNFITTGTVWARNFKSTGLLGSVNDVIVADDKAQQLFDNCFQVLDGPTSPQVEVVELDREIILKFVNPYTPSTIGYAQKDPAIAFDPEWEKLDSAARVETIKSETERGYFEYRFEGFQIFQVSGPDVSVDNLYDTEQSRLVAQSDIRNDVTQLVNFTADPDLVNGGLVPQDMTLESANEGIEVVYRFTEDEFAEGDRRLINNKEYYYYVVAYAQNQFKVFLPNEMSSDDNAQKTPYLAGRNLGNGQKPYLASPTKIAPKDGGTKVNANYGDEIAITRYDGAGNGGNFVKVTDQTSFKIARNGKMDTVHYQQGFGPFELKVIDPLEVWAGDFTLIFEKKSEIDSAHWVLRNNDGNKVIATSIYPISFLGEEIIDTLGLSVRFLQQETPGQDDLNLRNNGVIGGEITYADPRKPWLTGVPDVDGETPQNWILSGSTNITGTVTDPYTDYFQDADNPYDPRGIFESILGGTWAPAQFVNSTEVNTHRIVGGKTNNLGKDMMDVKTVGNVDIVITSDQNLWTRCPVIELGEVAINNEGGKDKFTLRAGPTMDKDGNGGLVPTTSTEDATGWSYFPGYAINVETGRRLNMAFGESSWLKAQNGDDMIWNPGAGLVRTYNTNPLWLLGGKHTVYVFGDSAKYDGKFSPAIALPYKGDNIKDHPLYNKITQFQNNPNRINDIEDFYASVAWVGGFPLITSEDYIFEKYSDIPTETRVSLRLDRPYQNLMYDGAAGYKEGPNDGVPMYGFNTTGMHAEKNNKDIANEALDLIRVVPNPYYGSSLYEDSQLDNIVKFTNLPQKCKISIFLSNGTLIRTINKDNQLSVVEWDLKNDYNVPIASGVYLIHIEAPGVGEKVIKWMGSMRPVDLNAF